MEETLPCLLEETHVYIPGSLVADRHLLAFYGEGTGHQEYYRTGFIPDTFRVKSEVMTGQKNLMISDNMKPLYTILEQIGDDLGFPSTRGPLFSSRYKLELFSSQKSNLRDSGFVAVDMETAFILQGVDALVIRTFIDMCNYDLSLPQNTETKMTLRTRAIRRAANLAMGVIRMMGK